MYKPRAAVDVNKGPKMTETSKSTTAAAASVESSNVLTEAQKKELRRCVRDKAIEYGVFHAHPGELSAASAFRDHYQADSEFVRDFDKKLLVDRFDTLADLAVPDISALVTEATLSQVPIGELVYDVMDGLYEVHQLSPDGEFVPRVSEDFAFDREPLIACYSLGSTLAQQYQRAHSRASSLKLIDELFRAHTPWEKYFIINSIVFDDGMSFLINTMLFGTDWRTSEFTGVFIRDLEWQRHVAMAMCHGIREAILPDPDHRYDVPYGGAFEFFGCRDQKHNE